MRQSSTEALPRLTAEAARSRFENFRLAFSTLQARLNAEGEMVPFAACEERGDGVLVITATDLWLSGDEGDKWSNVRTLYNLYQAGGDPQAPVVVAIADPRRNLRICYDGTRYIQLEDLGIELSRSP
jgi:hypothetical protein